MVVPVRGSEDSGAAELDEVRVGGGVGFAVEGDEMAGLVRAFEGEDDEDGAGGWEEGVGGGGLGGWVEGEFDGAVATGGARGGVGDVFVGEEWD